MRPRALLRGSAAVISGIREICYFVYLAAEQTVFILYLLTQIAVIQNVFIIYNFLIMYFFLYIFQIIGQIVV